MACSNNSQEFYLKFPGKVFLYVSLKFWKSFKSLSSSLFEHHVSETYIILKTSSHSPNCPFKFLKLLSILQILTCRALHFSKYCVLRIYCFTSFGLKYVIPKFDLVISLSKFLCGSFYQTQCKISFINTNINIFKIFGLRIYFKKSAFTAKEGQCLKFRQTKLMVHYWPLIAQVSYMDLHDCLIPFAFSNNSLLNSNVRPL